MSGKFRISFGLFIIFITIFSCQKSKLNKDTLSSENNLLVLSSVIDIITSTEYELERTEGIYKTTIGNESNCSSTTISPEDTTSWPKEFVIDFGRKNCLGIDGRTRRGQLRGAISKRYSEDNATLTIEPMNYYLDDNLVNCEISITKISTDNWDILIRSMEISGSDETITWESDLKRTRTEGSNTSFSNNPNDLCYLVSDCIVDDVFEYTGEALGINQSGRKFDFIVKNALRVKNCGTGYEITSGTMELQPEDLRLRTINFGNNECDNHATVVIDKTSYSINIY